MEQPPYPVGSRVELRYVDGRHHTNGTVVGYETMTGHHCPSGQPFADPYGWIIVKQDDGTTGPKHPDVVRALPS